MLDYAKQRVTSSLIQHNHLPTGKFPYGQFTKSKYCKFYCLFVHENAVHHGPYDTRQQRSNRSQGQKEFICFKRTIPSQNYCYRKYFRGHYSIQHLSPIGGGTGGAAWA